MAAWTRRDIKSGHHATEICAGVGDEMLEEASIAHAHQRIGKGERK